MKNILLATGLLAYAATFTACQDAAKNPAPAITSVPLLLPQLTADSDLTFDFHRTQASDNNLMNLANPTRPAVKFAIDLPIQRDLPIKAVQVYKSFRLTSLSALGPRTLAGEYTTFPAVVSLSSPQVLDGLLYYVPAAPPATVGSVRAIKAATPAATNFVFPGSQVLFTFEYVLADDSHVILTPLNTIVARPTNSTAAPTTYAVVTGPQLNAPYAISLSIR